MTAAEREIHVERPTRNFTSITCWTLNVGICKPTDRHMNQPWPCHLFEHLSPCWLQSDYATCFGCILIKLPEMKLLVCDYTFCLSGGFNNRNRKQQAVENQKYRKVIGETHASVSLINWAIREGIEGQGGRDFVRNFKGWGEFRNSTIFVDMKLLHKILIDGFIKLNQVHLRVYSTPLSSLY